MARLTILAKSNIKAQILYIAPFFLAGLRRRLHLGRRRGQSRRRRGLAAPPPSRCHTTLPLGSRQCYWIFVARPRRTGSRSAAGQRGRASEVQLQSRIVVLLRSGEREGCSGGQGHPAGCRRERRAGGRTEAVLQKYRVREKVASG